MRVVCWYILLCNRSLNNKFLLCKAYLMELLSRHSEALTVMNDISQVCMYSPHTHHVLGLHTIERIIVYTLTFIFTICARHVSLVLSVCGYVILIISLQEFLISWAKAHHSLLLKKSDLTQLGQVIGDVSCFWMSLI